jgi:hypothetical protein
MKTNRISEAFSGKSADGLTAFAVRFCELPFVGACWNMKEYHRGVQIGSPKVYATKQAARRAFLRALKKA